MRAVHRSWSVSTLRQPSSTGFASSARAKSPDQSSAPAAIRGVASGANAASPAVCRKPRRVLTTVRAPQAGPGASRHVAVELKTHSGSTCTTPNRRTARDIRGRDDHRRADAHVGARVRPLPRPGPARRWSGGRRAGRRWCPPASARRSPRTTGTANKAVDDADRSKDRRPGSAIEPRSLAGRCSSAAPAA